MPFDIPSLQTLITRSTADVNSRFGGTYNRLRRSVLAVLARVLAGLANGLYGYLGWISEQILPDTMDETRLKRFGAFYGVPYLSAAKAVGPVSVTGVNGSVVPEGALYQALDGTEYVTVSSGLIVGGVAQVDMEAMAFGAAANAQEGAVLTIVSPIPGVSPDAHVASGGIAGGSDGMSIEAYRVRVLERTGRYITGANAAVYEKWAKEVPGVTRAWVYENTPHAGAVTVLFVCENALDIIPDAAMIAAVSAYLEEHAEPDTGELVGRGVNVELVVDGPVAHPVNFTILPNPNTPAVRAAIQAELTDMIRRDSAPGADILISHIREAISIAAGETDYTLTAPTGNVAVADGDIAVMGTITWT